MKTYEQILLNSLFIFCVSLTFGQGGVQVVRGSVIDNISESPIPGAKISVLDSDPLLRTVSALDGSFRLATVPIGRQTLLISYPGYKEAVLKGLQITAGKEVVLEIRLEEDIVEQEEVKVIGKRDGPINEMSVVSTRTFSVEETQKYAAALNDPARMATSFAGVVATEGINNDISIRGNSPRGLIWRMEGMEIPNPNHFSSVGSSGGGISIISAQLLSNSDFSTGAFAAEYGNALSGIFDLSLWKGNNEKREYTVQAGVLGIDAAIEGPFKKGYGGSYLINYRYSTLGLLQYVVPIGDNVTNFQDVSFNVFLPTKKAGNFGLFGFGGLSDDTWKAEKDTALWSLEPDRQYQGVFSANTGMMGVWHKIRLGKNAYLKTNLGLSGTNNGDRGDSLDVNFSPHQIYEETYAQTRFTASTAYIQKLSAKDNLRAGIIYNRIGFSLVNRARQGGIMTSFLDESGSTSTAQTYFQFSHKFGKKVTLNGGLHYLYLLLNSTQSLEPRVSMRYQFSPKQALNFGYGIHSQIQPLGSYFAKVTDVAGEVTRPNMDLELNKAQHFVLSYDLSVNPYHRLHAEIYYQHLYGVPVGADADSTFSLLNEQYGYSVSALQSTGLGRNYGCELTFERNMKKGMYYLISASLFESKYQALNGEWYNTRYNTQFVVSATGGKDWNLKNENKRRVVGVNLKSVLSGGIRYTPFDLNNFTGDYPDRDNSKSFASGMPAYYRLDLRVSLKRDFKRITTTVAIDLQNVLNRKNVGGQYFDVETSKLTYWYHPGILPILSYRISF